MTASDKTNGEYQLQLGIFTLPIQLLIMIQWLNILQVRMGQEKQRLWPNYKELSTTRRGEDWNIFTWASMMKTETVSLHAATFPYPFQNNTTPQAHTQSIGKVFKICAVFSFVCRLDSL